ncbi:tetratricopeptide repeat protein [Solidesulfovibrio sp.]|uniref:tetratricopeptide repeat protein n=1 Tax=Solidesulfovibrio sp. TaxID=2910990 RepID=UPI0026272F54|nr:tetratricopeptide repeat protein [Solidesulfovibrio sp.]
MTPKSASAALEHPLRKPILALMATALAALFLTSFLDRAMVQGTRTARTQVKAKGPMAAVPELMTKLQQNPNDEETILQLADAFMRGKDWQRAEHFYGEALKIDPKNVGALFHRAIVNLEQRHFPEAVEDFKAVLAIKPDVAEAHYYIGMVNKYELKVPQAAKEHLEKALALAPKDKELAAETKKELENLQP